MSAGLDFFGAGLRKKGEAEAAARAERAPAAEADMFVLLADIWLDRPEVLPALRVVLDGFASMEGAPPALFVLMGDFQSTPFGPASGHLTSCKGARPPFRLQPPLPLCAGVPPSGARAGAHHALRVELC